MTTVAFLAEFTPHIGTGHVVEMLALAHEAIATGLRPCLIVSDASPPALLETSPVPVEIVPHFSPATLRVLGRSLAAAGVRLAVTNFRRVSAAQVTALADSGAAVICIDEVGEESLPATAVIRPSLTPADGAGAYAGIQYLPLTPEYRAHRGAGRPVAGPVRSVLVSMGGVDRTGATLRIVDALAEIRAPLERHIVVGGAFAWHAALAERARRLGAGWQIHESVPTLAGLIGAADVGITAGGNTLCEMACLGLPAIVLHEDPHEAAQGAAFAARGFGTVLGGGIDVSAAALAAALRRLDDPAVRRAEADAGRRLVDGDGAARIVRILVEQVSGDPALAS